MKLTLPRRRFLTAAIAGTTLLVGTSVTGPATTRGGNIEYLNLDPQLCDEKRCPIGNVTTSYYFDRDHLSVQGALRLMPSVQAALGKDRVPATSPTIMTKP